MFPTPTPHGVPSNGTATWYGTGGRCVQHHTLSCTPYRSGVRYLYAAVGAWNYHDKPFQLLVCRADQTRCVRVWVRDYCERCDHDLAAPWTPRSRAIDLSPYAFAQLAPLTKGILRVTISEVKTGHQ